MKMPTVPTPLEVLSVSADLDTVEME